MRTTADQAAEEFKHDIELITTAMNDHHEDDWHNLVVEVITEELWDPEMLATLTTRLMFDPVEAVQMLVNAANTWFAIGYRAGESSEHIKQCHCLTNDDDKIDLADEEGIKRLQDVVMHELHKHFHTLKPEGGSHLRAVKDDPQA